MSLTITYTNESSEVKSQNSQGNISLILGYNGRPYDLHVINDNNLRIRIGNQEGYINDINIDTNTLDDDEKYRGAFTIPLSNSVIQQLPPGVYYLEVWINVSDQNNQTQQMIFPSDDTLPFTLTPNIVNDSNSMPMITFDRVRQAWEDFKNFIMGHQAQIEDDLATFDGVTDSFVDKVDDGISGYQGFVNRAGSQLDSLANSGKANIGSAVTDANSNVADINLQVNSAKTQISTAANGVYSVVDSDVNSAEQAISATTASGNSQTASTVNSAENIINNAANGVVNTVNQTVNSAVTRVDNAADGIRGQVEGIVSSGDNRINNTAAGIESITSSAVSNASYISSSLDSRANSAVSNVNYTINSADNNMSNFASDINDRTSSADHHIDLDVSDAESNVDSTVASADSNMSNFASDINDRTSSADNHIDSDVTSADGHIDHDVASGDDHIDNTVSNADSHVSSNVISGETRISNDVTTGESNINSVASAANTNTTNIAQNNTNTINSTATSAVTHVDSDVQSTDDHMNSLFNTNDAKTVSAVSHIDSDATSVTNMAQTYSNNMNSQANSAYNSINASGINIYNGINTSGRSVDDDINYSAQSAYSGINTSASSAYINIDGYNGSASTAISSDTSSGISAVNSAYGVASSAIQYAVDHSDKLIESDITNGVKSSVSSAFNNQAISVQAQVTQTSNDVATINYNVTSLSNSTSNMAINVMNQTNANTNSKAESVLSKANKQANNQAYDIQDQINSLSDNAPVLVNNAKNSAYTYADSVGGSAINQANMNMETNRSSLSARGDDLQNQINGHPNWNDENWTRNNVVPNAVNSAKADANAHADQVATSAINQANANMEANRSSLSSRNDNMQAQINQNKNDILTNTIKDLDVHKLPNGTDLNSVTNTGFYSYNVSGNNAKNLPPYASGNTMTLEVINFNGGCIIQKSIDDNDNSIFCRSYVDNGQDWNSWSRLSHDTDIKNLQDQVSSIRDQFSSNENQIRDSISYNRNHLDNTDHNTLSTSDDLNNVNGTGFYKVNGGTLPKNSPNGASSNSGFLTVLDFNNGCIIQKYVDDHDNSVWYRSYINAMNLGWNNWRKLSYTDDLQNIQNNLQNQINNRPTWYDENWGRQQANQAATNALNQANSNMEANRVNLQNQIDHTNSNKSLLDNITHNSLSNFNLNNLIETGYYQLLGGMNRSVTNQPNNSSTNTGFIIVSRFNGDCVIQKYVDDNDNSVYYRSTINKGKDWNAWTRLGDQQDLQNKIDVLASRTNDTNNKINDAERMAIRMKSEYDDRITTLDQKTRELNNQIQETMATKQELDTVRHQLMDYMNEQFNNVNNEIGSILSRLN